MEEDRENTVAEDDNNQEEIEETNRVNIVLESIEKNDFEKLRVCFEDEEDPFHNLVHEMVKETGERGRSPFALACVMDRIEILRLLLEKIAPELNLTDNEGKSLLELCCILGRNEILQELLERGADINMKTARGYTALHRAAAWGRLECIKSLIKHEADMKIENDHGEMPVQTAKRYERKECMDYLEWADAKQQLQILIKETKETIEDPQKVLGRLTKDDKMTGLNACAEKQEWLDNTESPTKNDFVMFKKELQDTLQPIYIKLSEPPPEKPHRR